MRPCLAADPLETPIQMCREDGNIVVPGCEAVEPRPDPHLLVLDGTLALAMPALRSAVLSCSHCTAEG